MVTQIRGSAAVGLFVLRMVVGVAFIVHGYPKIQHPMDWMGPNAFAPDWLQATAAFAEFLGGIALIAGILTRLAALLLLCDMAVALWMVELPSGASFVGAGHTYELNAVYLAVMFFLVLGGAGALSVDAALTAGRRRAPAAEIPLREHNLAA